MQNTIANLTSKGVYVTEIEKQTQSTSDNIAIIEAQIEELPFTNDALIIQYRAEKELQRKLNVNKDHVKDREMENKTLFESDNFKDTVKKRKMRK